jgi:hypothetical protein
VHLARLKGQLEAMSHYEGTAPMPSMGSMDNPDRKRAEANEPPTNCYLLNGTSLDINCDSHKCISLILDLVEEYDAIFGELCSPAETPGFEVDEETLQLVTGLRALPKCNQCVISYTKFTKLEEKMKATSCYPTTTHFKCDEDCNFHLEKYSTLFEEMLGGICRMYNPGLPLSICKKKKKKKTPSLLFPTFPRISSHFFSNYFTHSLPFSFTPLFKLKRKRKRKKKKEKRKRQSAISCECPLFKGGCGDMGGLTEGDIYDLLNSMHSEISRVETVSALCSTGCPKPMEDWYLSWKPLVSKGCISSEDVDLTKNSTVLESFKLDLQCDGDCRTEV